MLGHSVPCRKCRYNLRGLPTSGNCPECGTPVQFSLQSDVLANSDPGWLKSLHSGAVMILWGIAVIVLGFLAIFGLAMTVLSGPAVGSGAVTTMVILMVTILLGVLLTWIGTWWMTKEDPSGLGEDRYGTARKVIRVTLLLGVVEQVISIVANATGNTDPANPLILVGAALGLVSIIGWFAFFLYLSKLAMRVPDPAMAGRAKLIMWGVGIPVVISQVSELIGALQGGGGVVTAFGCIAGLAGLAALIFGIMAILFLDKYRRMLKWAVGEAERNWQNRGAAGRM